MERRRRHDRGRETRSSADAQGRSRAVVVRDPSDDGRADRRAEGDAHAPSLCCSYSKPF
jgi:hypothetical protein